VISVREVGGRAQDRTDDERTDLLCFSKRRIAKNSRDLRALARHIDKSAGRVTSGKFVKVDNCVKFRLAVPTGGCLGALDRAVAHVLLQKPPA
jgi:hypothetical protein